MAWYESKKGWGFSVLAVGYFLLDHYGYVTSITEIFAFARRHWPKWTTISSWIAPALFVAAIIFFEVDRRRHGKPHPQTLKAHALKVRDDMQMYLDSLGEKEKGFRDGETDVEFLTRSSAETGRRWNLLGHYFGLNWASEVSRLFHEFGIRGVHEETLHVESSPRLKEEEYKGIIESLTRVAQTPEADAKVF